jgi:hypothetical protein
MSGGGGTDTQVVQQDSKPWEGQQPYLFDLWNKAQDASNKTNRNMFQGDLFAGPTGAQQEANRGLVDLSKRLQGQQNPGQLAQNVISQQATGANAQRQGSRINLGGPLQQQAFQPTAAPAQTQVQGTEIQNRPQASYQNFAAQSAGPAQDVAFQQQALAPTGQYGSAADTGAAIEQVAGQNPNAQPSGLQAAIEAALAPITREWTEQTNPLMQHMNAMSGTSGNSRAAFETARAFENAVARPGTEIASQLVYQDELARAGRENENYQLMAQLGARAQESSADRRAQDLAQLRAQGLSQTQSLNQLGLQDVAQQRDLQQQDQARTDQQNLDFIQSMNQLAQGDAAQQRALQEQEAGRLDQLNLQQALSGNQIESQNWRDMMSLLQRDLTGQQERGLQDVSNIRNLAAQIGMQENQLDLQDVMNQRGLGQSAAQSLPQIFSQNMTNDMVPLQMMGQAGAQQQGWNQGFLDEARQLYELQVQAPWQGLGQYSNIVQNSPFVSSTQTNTTPSQSTLGGALQGGLGAGMGALALGASGPVGWGLAGLGALAGAFG